MPSPYVINCPNCHKDIGEEEAEFKPADKKDESIVTCKLCEHTWTAHHRNFRKRGTPLPNPFTPIHIPGVD
jgi:hypothetical protein